MLICVLNGLLLTRCNAKYIVLETTYHIWKTFREQTLESLLFMGAESKVNDTIDFG